MELLINQEIFIFVYKNDLLTTSRFLVPMVGFEPTRLSALDFESSTSASSITSAMLIVYSNKFDL